MYPSKLPFHRGGISSFFPDKDSLQIGDTLWFSCSFPTNLKYLPGGAIDSSVVNLRGASNVSTDLNFHAIPKKDTITEALDSFKITPQKGAIQTNPLLPHGAETITFAEEQNYYTISFGIIPQKRGIYCITIIDIYQLMKNCTKASVTIPISNSIDQHLYFLSDAYFPGSRYEPSIPDYELTHDYAFKVY